MSDILIKGMEMPKRDLMYGAHIVVRPNGDVVDYLNGVVISKASQLSPHGPLIERDKLYFVLKKDFCGTCKKSKYGVKCPDCAQMAILAKVVSAPVILEASE